MQYADMRPHTDQGCGSYQPSCILHAQRILWSGLAVALLLPHGGKPQRQSVVDPKS